MAGSAWRREGRICFQGHRCCWESISYSCGTRSCFDGRQLGPLLASSPVSWTCMEPVTAQNQPWGHILLTCCLKLQPHLCASSSDLQGSCNYIGNRIISPLSGQLISSLNSMANSLLSCQEQNPAFPDLVFWAPFQNVCISSCCLQHCIRISISPLSPAWPLLLKQ